MTEKAVFWHSGPIAATVNALPRLSRPIAAIEYAPPTLEEAIGVTAKGRQRLREDHIL